MAASLWVCPAAAEIGQMAEAPEAQQLALGPFPTPESPGQKLQDSPFQIPKVCREFRAAGSFLFQTEILSPEGNLRTDTNFPLPKDPS